MLRRIAVSVATAIAVMVPIVATAGATSILADDPPNVCLHPHPWGCSTLPTDPWEWD